MTQARLPFDEPHPTPTSKRKPTSKRTPRRSSANAPNAVKNATPASPVAAGQSAVLTVTALNRLVKAAIERELPGTVRVVGELSNVSRPASGHLYFTLKDETSEVRCAMWQSAAAYLKFDPLDGLEVIATGQVDVYEPRGQYQLYVRRLEPCGVGALELAFRQLKQKLAGEGLFDPAGKKKLPLLPRRIGVVTSGTGAAIRDVLQTLRRRFPALTIFVFPVKVQGEGAADEIADAIRRINSGAAALGGVDVLIVGRGGGSLEDLWAFNEEIVARAIHASRIPVVSAVGHEVDFTIADFVADVRAATPTAAAEIVVPVLTDLLDALDESRTRLTRAAARHLERAQARLTLVERFEWFRDPLGRVRERQQWLDETTGRLGLVLSRSLAARRAAAHELELRLWRVRPEAILARRRERLSQTEHRLRWALGQCQRFAERRLAAGVGRLLAASPRQRIDRGRDRVDQSFHRLDRAMMRRVEIHNQVLSAFAARLAASSHEGILRRGFSITRRADDGRVVRRAADLRIDDDVRTRTADGEFTSRVTKSD